MKKYIINKAFLLIKNNNNNLNKEKEEELKYGLEAIYLTYSKIILILILALISNIFKECLLILVTYNIIRTFSYGLHATKSIYCLITSLTCFIGGVYICEYINFPLTSKIGLAIFCIICLIKYAPADTEKRPLINVKKRKKFKIISVGLGIIYLILIVIFAKYTISNYLLIGMLESVLMIHPLVYKLFNLPFNNYKNYKYEKSY